MGSLSIENIYDMDTDSIDQILQLYPEKAMQFKRLAVLFICYSEGNLSDEEKIKFEELINVDKLSKLSKDSENVFKPRNVEQLRHGAREYHRMEYKKMGLITDDLPDNNLYKDIEDWDVSLIDDMSGLFANSKLDFCLNKWNTSNVKNMSSMFEDAVNFTNGKQPLIFDTSEVEDMSGMFHGAAKFANGGKPLRLDTRNVKDMSKMFQATKTINVELVFDFRNVVNMDEMFYVAEKFDNGGVDLNWNCYKVKTAVRMFNLAGNFKRCINGMITSSLKDMSYMFTQTKKFNNGGVDLEIDTRNVTNMERSFEMAEEFRVCINKLNTSKVRNMSGTLALAKKFNNGGKPLTISFKGITQNENLYGFLFKARDFDNGGEDFKPEQFNPEIIEITSEESIYGTKYETNGRRILNENDWN